ncbi:MAG: DUF3575 domain-containing protein [Bacteroidia bacterium]|jgi:hypothetical protein|nr:DUF3575 domain-containing protein [Bacteroidia bacterium]
MKKNLILALALGFCGIKAIKAQTHDVSLNIAPIVFSNYSVNYMFNFTDEMSVGSVIGYQNITIDDPTVAGGEIKYTGFYLAPEFRYYFNPDEGNDKFYAGGYLKYRNAGTSGDIYTGFLADGSLVNYDVKNNGVALGIVFGKLWQTRVGLNFTLWSGVGYYLFDNESYTNNYDPDKDPNLITINSNLPSLDFRFGVNVGYRIGN